MFVNGENSLDLFLYGLCVYFILHRIEKLIRIVLDVEGQFTDDE